MVSTSSDEVSDKLKACMTHRLISFLGWNVSLKVPLYTWSRTILTQQNLPLQSQWTNLTYPQPPWFLFLYHIASFQLPKPKKEIPSFLVTNRRCFPVSSQKLHAKPKIPTSSQHLALCVSHPAATFKSFKWHWREDCVKTLENLLAVDTGKSWADFRVCPRPRKKFGQTPYFFVTRERMSELSYADFSEGKELDCWSLV